MESKKTEIRLPDLGEIDEARVVQWLRDVDAVVATDEDLLEVETEKTTFVVPSPIAGRLIEIVAPEGESVKRGGVLGRIEQSG